MLISIYWLLACSSLFNAYAGELEAYSNRPSIESVSLLDQPNVARNDLPAVWERTKLAQLKVAAELVGLYLDNPNERDHELYFIGRDTEYIYDLVKLELKNEPSLLKRIHLIGVSRTNLEKSYIKYYLSQNGLSIERISKGLRPVFVDTGLLGTISNGIEDLYPKEFRGFFKTHLLASNNPQHPSSRVFLSELDSTLVQLPISQAHDLILSYENLPRFTEGPIGFSMLNGRWDSISPKGNVETKLNARRYVESMKRFALEEPNRKIFSELRGLFHQLHTNALYSIDRNQVLALLREAGKKPNGAAIILDYYEFHQKRYPELSDNLPSLIEFGLNEKQPSLVKAELVIDSRSLISRHPDWREVLENPGEEIPLLIRKKESAKLREIWPTLISQGNKNVIRRLTPQFRYPHSADWKAELSSLIDRGDEKIFEDLAMSAFSKPHAIGWGKELQTVIDRGDKSTLQSLAMFAFSEPHSSVWKGPLHSLIEKADQVTLQRLGMYAFSKPHSVAWRDELRRIIARADRKTLQALESQVFSQPHASLWKEERNFLSSKLK